MTVISSISSGPPRSAADFELEVPSLFLFHVTSLDTICKEETSIKPEDDCPHARQLLSVRSINATPERATLVTYYNSGNMPSLRQKRKKEKKAITKLTNLTLPLLIYSKSRRKNAS